MTDFSDKRVQAGTAVVLITVIGVVAFVFAGQGYSDNPETSTADKQPSTSQPVVEVVSASPDRTIEATNFEFSNSSISVDNGTVVKFVNQEGAHTVTLDTAGIDRTISGGESVTLRFNQAGTYQVYCRFHGSPGSRMHTDVQVSS